MLVKEIKSKDVVSKIWVDQGKKLVKCVMNGKADDNLVAENNQVLTNELKKFNKGEPVYLLDATNADMRFLSPALAKLIEEFGAFIATYCKKVAYVVPGFMLQKSVETVIADKVTNDKYFATEHEAIKWLLE